MDDNNQQELDLILYHRILLRSIFNATCAPLRETAFTCLCVDSSFRVIVLSFGVGADRRTSTEAHRAQALQCWKVRQTPVVKNCDSFWLESWNAR